MFSRQPPLSRIESFSLRPAPATVLLGESLCALYAFVDCSGAIGATTPSGDVIATDLDFANYLPQAPHVGVVHGSAFGVENHARCGSRMLFRCPRCATRAGASRPRVRR
ncbi:aspartate aminotransferase A [Burkholderia sp. YI23]|nr:aspartate aminotransferase A [Burkholderia sp. YI23]